MKVIIFGGTGETGLLVIQKALAEGHRIQVYARSPSKISFRDEKLTIVQGELSERNKIDGVIKGADAVISVLGPTGKTKGFDISKGVKGIVESMEKHGVKRLIATATPSFSDPHDKFQLSFAFAVFMIKTLAKNTYLDIVELGKAISRSKLD